MRSPGLRRAAMLAASLATAAAAPCGTVVLPAAIGAGSPAAVTGLHPLIGSSLANNEINQILYRPLFWVGRGADIDWTLSLASALNVSDDGLTWHVTIGDQWTWSDGVPITADDVLYCLELIRALGNTWAGKGQADMPDIIESLIVTGPKTFDVRLTHRTSRQGFLLGGLSLLVPLPRHAWHDTPTDEMWRRQTDLSFFDVVSGPYKVTRFELGRYLVMEANPAYSGAVKPRVQRVVDNFLEGVEQIRALQSGDVDAVNIPLTVWDAATALPGYRIVKPAPGYSFNYIGLNFQNEATPFFQDLRVRQAMADAMNIDDMLALAYHGQGYDVRGPVPPALTDLLSEDARAGRYPVHYDPERAKHLLDEAGWVPGADGIRVKDGRRLSFRLLIPSGETSQVLVNQVLQRNLLVIGMEMPISALSFTQMLPIVYGPKSGWEAYHLAWFFGPWPDGLPFFGSKGENNRGGYSDARMDEIVERLQSDDGPETARLYNDYAAAQQPILFLPNPDVVILARPGVEGLTDFLYPHGGWAPEFLHLSGDMACDARHDQPS